jgi:hypothetical protein
MDARARFALGFAFSTFFISAACITSIPVDQAPGKKAASSGTSVGPSLSECASGMIDDLEDGNAQIFPSEGRGGYCTRIPTASARR